MPQEPKSRSPRIEINPEVWPALQVEAVIRRMSPKDLVNMLIIKNMSPKAREFMEPKPHDTAIPEAIATKEPMSPSPHEPPRRTATVADISQKRKRLADNPDALRQIRELWSQSPRPSLAKMSKQIGYPKSTIAEHVKAMKERGEISD